MAHSPLHAQTTKPHYQFTMVPEPHTQYNAARQRSKRPTQGTAHPRQCITSSRAMLPVRGEKGSVWEERSLRRGSAASSAAVVVETGMRYVEVAVEAAAVEAEALAVVGAAGAAVVAAAVVAAAVSAALTEAGAMQIFALPRSRFS
jgi:hypothetical protein